MEIKVWTAPFAIRIPASSRKVCRLREVVAPARRLPAQAEEGRDAVRAS